MKHVDGRIRSAEDRRPRSAHDTLVRSWMASYRGLFKVPIIEPPSFDGTRDTSGHFQEEIDGTIDALVKDLQIPFIALDPNDRDGWV